MGSGTDTIKLSEESIADLADALRGGGGSYGGGGGGGTTSFTRSFEKLGTSLEGLAGSLNNGTQGMSAYNGVIGSGTAVFQQFIKPLGDFGKVVGTIVGASSEYIQQVNKQTDALAKSYQDISGVGAAGKDGLQGVFTTMQQFGLGIADLPKFNALIKESSVSLADFGGTVVQGLTAFANLTEGIQRTGLQTELIALGQTTDSINKGLGGFLKTTTMLGNSTRLLNMTTEQQAKAASDYIKEQDKITKLTGASAEQQQKSLEAALSNDRFAADRYLKEQKLAELEASGQTAAAAQLQAQINKETEIRNKYTGSMQQGYLDFVAGAGAQTEAGRAFMNAVGQQGMAALRDPMKDSAAALTEANAGVAAQLKQFGPTIIAAGKLEFLPAVKDMMVAAGSKINEMSAAAAVGQQKSQIETPERALATYNAMTQAQTDVVRGFQNLIQLGMTPVTNAMSYASTKIKQAVELIPGSRTTRPAGSPQAYITEKEQTERGRTEIVSARNAVAPVVPDDVKEKIRKDLREDIESLQKWLGDTVTGLTTRIPSLNQAGSALADSAKSAGNAVSGAVDSVVDQFNRMRNRLNEVAPSLRTPAAGQTAALPTNQVAAFQPPSSATTAKDINVEKFGTLIASLGDKIGIATTARDAKFERFENLTSSLQDRLSGATTARDTRFEGFGTTLASLLSDMRKSTGPKNNYNPSLTNAVYTPPINREEDTYKTNTADAAEQYSKDQIIAFNTMSGKLDDMITLLSKSVNIQGDTLRATYSA